MEEGAQLPTVLFFLSLLFFGRGVLALSLRSLLGRSYPLLLSSLVRVLVFLFFWGYLPLSVSG
mgnify:CR=1 FL=1